MTMAELAVKAPAPVVAEQRQFATACAAAWQTTVVESSPSRPFDLDHSLLRVIPCRSALPRFLAQLPAVFHASGRRLV